MALCSFARSCAMLACYLNVLLEYRPLSVKFAFPKEDASRIAGMTDLVRSCGPCSHYYLIYTTATASVFMQHCVSFCKRFTVYCCAAGRANQRSPWTGPAQHLTGLGAGRHPNQAAARQAEGVLVSTCSSIALACRLCFCQTCCQLTRLSA